MFIQFGHCNFFFKFVEIQSIGTTRVEFLMYAPWFPSLAAADCDFEFDSCGYQPHPLNDFDWTRVRAEDATTDLQHDHSYGTSAGEVNVSKLDFSFGVRYCWPNFGQTSISWNASISVNSLSVVFICFIVYIMQLMFFRCLFFSLAFMRWLLLGKICSESSNQLNILHFCLKSYNFPLTQAMARHCQFSLSIFRHKQQGSLSLHNITRLNAPRPCEAHVKISVA